MHTYNYDIVYTIFLFFSIDFLKNNLKFNIFFIIKKNRRSKLQQPSVLFLCFFGNTVSLYRILFGNIALENYTVKACLACGSLLLGRANCPGKSRHLKEGTGKS